MKAWGCGNSDTLWNNSEYRASKSTTSFVIGCWLGFGLAYFPLAPFSILFLMDECRRGTSGAWFPIGTGVGGALTWVCELMRWGGSGGADESETSALRSRLLILFDDPELGNFRGADRHCSIIERFKAFVDFAWLLVKFVPGKRLGTGGGGGLFVGLCAAGFWIGDGFIASWIFCWLLEFIRIVPKWLSDVKGPEGERAVGGDLKNNLNF